MPNFDFGKLFTRTLGLLILAAGIFFSAEYLMKKSGDPQLNKQEPQQSNFEIIEKMDLTDNTSVYIIRYKYGKYLIVNGVNKCAIWHL